MKDSKGCSESLPEWKRETIDAAAKMQGLKALLGVTASERLQDEAERQQRMIAAEDARVAELMGWDLKACKESAMNRNTQVGDNFYPHPPQVVYPPQPAPQPEKKSILGPVALAMLGAAIPGAGVAGFAINHFLNQPDPIVIPESPDETVGVGLKRLEELGL